MKQLSTFKYLKSNLKRVIPIAITICFGIVLMNFVIMIINSSNEIVDKVYINTAKHYAYLTSTNSDNINKRTLDNINKNSSIKKIIPGAVKDGIDISSASASSVTTSLFCVKNKDAKLILTNFNLKLIKGRLFRKEKSEIVIHKLVAENMGIKIGSKVGYDINSKYQFHKTYKVVGIADGNCVIGGIAPFKYENMADKDILKHSMILVPKSNKFKSFNNFLNNIKDNSLYITYYDQLIPRLKNVFGMIHSMIYLVEILIIIVLVLSIANINRLNFYNRKKEFGILAALGYRKNVLYKKIFFEMLIISSLSFIVGMIFSYLLGWIINNVVFVGRGKELALISGDMWLTILIPVFVTTLSILPAMKMLKKIEPIEIIEGV